MADIRKRLDENTPGEFFVDSTCIDCDTCREIAPQTFYSIGDYSAVHAQPSKSDEEHLALMALVACPTGSIGTLTKHDLSKARTAFPLQIEENVYYCGFVSQKSYGGSSYFYRSEHGNWLIDSPKYMPELAERFEAMGGIQHIFLTHRDDVADADRYAKRFGATRHIHVLERSAQPEAEDQFSGFAPIELAPDVLAIPTPGHTRGHTVLLVDNKYLFTGDHLWFSRTKGALSASRSVCWYDWSEQVRSLRKLLDFDFEWVLPGHGTKYHLPQEGMRAALVGLLHRIDPAD